MCYTISCKYFENCIRGDFMFNNGALDPETIVNYILLTAEAREQILEFVTNLDNQGILKLFINGQKLDELMATLRKESVLSGNFAWIDFSSEYLVRDFNSEFICCFATQLSYNGVCEKSEIIPKIRELISELSEPASALGLYLWLFEYAAMVSNNFAQAINYYYSCHPGIDIHPMVKMMTSAIPAVRKYTANCKYWAITRPKTFNKVNIESFLPEAPFDASYQYFFKEALKTAGGCTKEQIYEETVHMFKLMLIDDVFEKITSSKKRTSGNISAELMKMYEERKIYIYIKFVRACFEVSLDDMERARIKYENENPVMPAYSNNGFGNIPS